MRVVVLLGCLLAAILAAACTDVPTAPRQGLVPPTPSFSHWSTPVRCYSTQSAVAPHEDAQRADPILTTQEEIDAANAADANGNGWACLNLVEVSFGVYELPPEGQRTSFSDDFTTCPDGYTAEFRGDDPADDNGNGFVCVSGGGDVVDDAGDNEGGETGGGGLGGSIECEQGIPTLVGLDAELLAADENGNGWVCVLNKAGFPPVHIVEDDILAAPPTLTLTAGKVNGHGTYDVGSQTLSFSFHAISDGESVRGNFEFHNRTGDIRFHGDVTCMEVDGGTALLEGVVTNDKQAGPGDGTAIVWTAVDNGEGKKAAGDEVARPEVTGDWLEACGAPPTEPTTVISGGNVQVR
jgi:hypothetical protein